MQQSRLLTVSAFAFGIATCLFASPQISAAQGLIWRVPSKDMPLFKITYYGSYTQTDEPAVKSGKQRITKWDRRLIIESLGTAPGYYEGKQVTCRRLKISVRTGHLVDGEIEPGPSGERIYKVLVPESRIIGKEVDSDSIFVSFLPIATDKAGKVQGTKKIGDSPEKPIKSPVLQVYPVLTLLDHYRTMTKSTQPASITVAKNVSPTAVAADEYTAKRVVESSSTRSTNDARFYVAQGQLPPTGLVQWKVTLTREKKNSSQSRSEFKKVTTIVTEMVATEFEHKKPADR